MRRLALQCETASHRLSRWMKPMMTLGRYSLAVFEYFIFLFVCIFIESICTYFVLCYLYSNFVLIFLWEQAIGVATVNEANYDTWKRAVIHLLQSFICSEPKLKLLREGDESWRKKDVRYLNKSLFSTSSQPSFVRFCATTIFKSLSRSLLISKPHSLLFKRRKKYALLE